jgi:hypothetical protein
MESPWKRSIVDETMMSTLPDRGARRQRRARGPRLAFRLLEIRLNGIDDFDERQIERGRTTLPPCAEGRRRAPEGTNRQEGVVEWKI